MVLSPQPKQCCDWLEMSAMGARLDMFVFAITETDRTGTWTKLARTNYCWFLYLCPTYLPKQGIVVCLHWSSSPRFWLNPERIFSHNKNDDTRWCSLSAYYLPGHFTLYGISTGTCREGTLVIGEAVRYSGTAAPHNPGVLSLLNSTMHWDWPDFREAKDHDQGHSVNGEAGMRTQVWLCRYY